MRNFTYGNLFENMWSQNEFIIHKYTFTILKWAMKSMQVYLNRWRVKKFGGHIPWNATELFKRGCSVVWNRKATKGKSSHTEKQYFITWIFSHQSKMIELLEVRRMLYNLIVDRWGTEGQMHKIIERKYSLFPSLRVEYCHTIESCAFQDVRRVNSKCSH